MTTNTVSSLRRLLTVLEDLPDAVQSGPVDAAGWTIRDHVTHMAAWADGIAALLQRKDRWHAMGLTPLDIAAHDLDAMNQRIADRSRTMSPAQACDWLIAAQQRVDAALSLLRDDQLREPYDRFVPPFSGDDGDPIVVYIINNTYEHYDEHLPWITAIAASRG